MKGRQVLLTGGTGGLGMGVTAAVLVQGGEVTIPYHNEKEVERLKGKLAAAEFERIRFVAANLSDESVVEQLINDMGRVDVLIHLVGGFAMGKTHEYSFADWQRNNVSNIEESISALNKALLFLLIAVY